MTAGTRSLAAAASPICPPLARLVQPFEERVLPRRDCPRDRATQDRRRGIAGCSGSCRSSTRSREAIGRSLELDEVLAGALQRLDSGARRRRAAPFDCAMTSPALRHRLRGRSAGRREMWEGGRVAAAERSRHREPEPVSSSRTSRGTPASDRGHLASPQLHQRADAAEGRARRHSERRRDRAAPVRRRRRAAAHDHRRPDHGSPCRTRGCMDRFGAASASGSRPSTRSAIRLRCSTGTAFCCAATRRWRRSSDKPVTELRSQGLPGHRFLRRIGPDCVGHAIADARPPPSAAEVTLPDGHIFSRQHVPIAGEPGGASVVQVAKNVTEEIRSARRLRQMSEELGRANARLTTRPLEQLQVHAGAAAPGGEAVGDRSARGGSRARVEQPVDQRHRLRAAARRGAARVGGFDRGAIVVAAHARPAADRRGIGAGGADRAQPAGVCAASDRGPRATGRRRHRQPRAVAADLRVQAQRRRAADRVRAGPAGGRCRRQPDPAGAAQSDPQRRAGDARPARRSGSPSARGSTRRPTPSSCRSPTAVTASITRTCRASSIRSSPPATSARARASV